MGKTYEIMADELKSQAMRQESIQFRLASVLATLLLIGIETYFLLPAISYDGTIIPLASMNPQAQYSFDFLLPTNIGFFVLYCLIPVVFCSFASVLSRPKKLVNPIIVQGGVMAIAGLTIIFKIALATGIQYQSALLVGLLLGIITLSVVIALVIAIMQWVVLVWVIAMNYESSDEKSFVINLTTKAILHKLGSSFLDDFNFSRECDLGDIWRLKRTDGNFRWLLLEIGPLPDDGTKSIVSTVAYEIQSDWIVKSSSASNVRDTILDSMEKRLGLTFTDNTTDLSNPVSRLAIGNVKDLGRSRIEVTWVFLRRVSRFYQIAISLTVTLLLALSIIYFYLSQNINFSTDSYVVTTVALIIALIVEIGLPLRDELNKKKREELEF
jgi:hypothetical protein